MKRGVMNPAKATRPRAWMLALIALGSALATAASAESIVLPPETARYAPSELPGYRLVQQHCMTCHSAQYVLTQPPSSPRSYWSATVKKMKAPFGAPIPDEDMPAIVDYLTKTYGAERTATAAATPSSDKTVPSPAPLAGGRDPQALLAANNCTACHAVDKKVVGPAFKDVAAKYAHQPDAIAHIEQSIRGGGSGRWGQVPMPPFPDMSREDAQRLAAWILGR